MSKSVPSKQALRRKVIAKYLLEQGEHKTTKQIAAATGFNRKDIARSLSDIKESEDYVTHSLTQPFRVKLQCAKHVNQLWETVLLGCKRK